MLTSEADQTRHVRELEERFELVMRATSDGLWDWNLLTNEVYFSPRWKSMLGYEEHEIPHHFEEWRKRVHPDDLEQALATIQAHLDGATPSYELEHRLRHKDGTYRWIYARGTSLRDASGRVYRMAGSHVDVTERRQAEEALREREAQYRGIFDATSDGLVITDLETGLLVEVNPAFATMHGYTREELIGTDPHRFIHPDSHYLLHEYLDEVKAGREYHTQAIDVRKDGSLLHVEVHGAAFAYKGRACVLGVVRDITERVQAYQLLEQRVQERTRELSTVLDVSNIVASTLELKPLLGLILDQLKVVADYTGASILTLEGDELLIMEVRGASARDPDVVGLRFQLEVGTPIADMIVSRQPIMIADVRGDAPLAHAYRGAVRGLLETPSFSYVRSWLALPLVLNDQVTGILSLSHEQPGYYTERHAQLAGAIANHAAVAIENAKLYARAQGAAALEERQRLARELHDSVTQSLFSMTLISGALPRILDRDAAQARERITRLHELANGALAEMRALIFELRPDSLEREGLVAVLDKQAAALRAQHGIAVNLSLDEEPAASPDVKEAVYRIAREALHNTVKHARATRIDVRLTCDAGVLVLDVRDDGIGFDPAGPFPGHMGQRTMRERAVRLGGTLTVESAPGKGACVRARIPLTAAAGRTSV